MLVASVQAPSTFIIYVNFLVARLLRDFTVTTYPAVAHAILRIYYYLLTREEMYVDLGEDYFDKQRQQSIVRHSVRRLEGLGYTVTIEEPKVS